MPGRSTRSLDVISMDSGVEERFIASFVQPARRDRWLEMLRGKGRKKQLERLYHHFEFEARSVTKLKLITDEAIISALAERGSPASCYVISADSSIDGCAVQLREFLAERRGMPDATVLIGIPEKLALFRDEYHCYLMENGK